MQPHFFIPRSSNWFLIYQIDLPNSPKCSHTWLNHTITLTVRKSWQLLCLPNILHKMSPHTLDLECEVYLWGRRDDFLYHQEKHSEWDENGSTKRDFLSTVRRQIEDQHSQKGQPNAGNDKEERVKQREAPDDKGVSDKRIGACRVYPQATAPCSFHNLPFTIVKVVSLVHMNVLQEYVHLRVKEQFLTE